MSLIQYRALAACIAGGGYRRPGEVFSMAEMKHPPKHLEKVGEKPAAVTETEANNKPSAKKERKTGKPAAVTAAEAPGLDDIGGGQKIDSADVTSADIIKK